MSTAFDAATGAPDRFLAPLYTVGEAARWLAVPASTLSTWARGHTRLRPSAADVSGDPVLTTVKRLGGPRGPDIPFVGLAEGLVLTAMRRSGVPLQRIRPALAAMEKEFGLPHALASRKLYTDGAEVLFDYAVDADDAVAGAVKELVVVRSGQRVLNAVVEQYLSRVTYGEDGYASLLRLPGYTEADVVADPLRSFGRPVFSRGGARVDDALAMFRGGESLETVAEEYRVPPAELEDAVRVATLAIS